MAKIKTISTISGNREWYAVYDDSDSMTDYFNSTRGSQKYITQRVMEDGADLIEAQIQNGYDVKEKDIKGIQRLAQRAGYTCTLTTEPCKSMDGTVWVRKWAELTKKKVA